MQLNVQSIFNSIDGEFNGFDGAGQLSTFIRLKGCNLSCRWCDTKYARESEPKNMMDVEHILKEITLPKVTITGGEPLLQQESLVHLVSKLWMNKIKVTIETNGTIFPDTKIWGIFLQSHSLRKDLLRFVVDYKLPSSGCDEEIMDLLFFASLREYDAIKFVVANLEDLTRAYRIINEHPGWLAKKVISPIPEDSWPSEVATTMIYTAINNSSSDIYFSLQLHKVLWPNVGEGGER